MPTDVESLEEMGFSVNRAQRALAKTGYKGVAVAMDWLFAHADDPDIDDPFEAPKGHLLTDSIPSPGGEGGPSEISSVEEGGSSEPQLVKSLKCDECNKLLRTQNDVQLHAGRTGHSSFSESVEEIKPLTEEERKAQLAQVQELLKLKRAEKDEREKQEKILREKARRVQGKEMIQMKQKLEEDEMKKIVEQRRREKEQEKQAKQRVREQIEKDKKDRAAKFGGGVPASGSDHGAASEVGTRTAAEVSARDGPKAGGAAASAATQPPTQVIKEYTQTKIQVRLPNGESLTQSFLVKEQLSAVRLYVQLNRKDGDNTPFTFKTTFPSRVFSNADMDTPLQGLDLVPSAVLLVTKIAPS